MTRKQIKASAQNELLHGMQMAFSEPYLSDAIKIEMSHQMARVEKLLGYVPFSWVRGT